MKLFNITFDLKFEGEIKHIKVEAIEFIFTKEFFEIAEYRSGVCLKWNTKDISKLKIVTEDEI